MKHICLTLIIILWLLFTLFLTLTILGIPVICLEDKNNKPYWFSYLDKLIEALSV